MIRTGEVLVFISGSFGKISPACRNNSPQAESPIQTRETLSAFHPHAQRNAFNHRGVRQRSGLFALWNPRLRPGPNSNRIY